MRVYCKGQLTPANWGIEEQVTTEYSVSSPAQKHLAPTQAATAHDLLLWLTTTTTTTTHLHGVAGP
jgi:hypothetical protein